MALKDRLEDDELAFPAPDDPDAPEAEQGEDALKGAGYTGPEERCFSCKNFDGDAKCELFDAEVSEQGHCRRFEVGGEEEEGAAVAEEEAEDEEVPEFE